VASKGRQAALIATPSEPGRELATSVREMAERKRFTLDVLTTPAQPEVARAIERYDVVILDATVEPGGKPNYPGFTAQPQVMSHVLVVSRTPLPLNFHASGREGRRRIRPLSAMTTCCLGSIPSWTSCGMRRRGRGWNARCLARC
jgi:hypothetical protein